MQEPQRLPQPTSAPPVGPRESRAVSHRENTSLHSSLPSRALVPHQEAAGHSPHCRGQDDTGVVAEVGNGGLSQQQISEDVAPKAVQHSTEPGGKRALPGHLHGSCEKNWGSRSHQCGKGPSRPSSAASVRRWI